MLFDNNFDASASEFAGQTALRVIHVNEAAATAEVVWQLELAEKTCVYGDNDRLPSGNLLASAWPYSIDATPGVFQYDARVFETVRATKKTAWEAFVVGKPCVAPDDGSGACVRAGKTGGYPTGWSMYSAERHYTKPLLHNISCTQSATDDGMTELHFATCVAIRHRRRRRHPPAPGGRECVQGA